MFASCEPQNGEGINADTIGMKCLLKRLDPKHQAILELVYKKGYIQAEAAETIGIPLCTLKTRTRTACSNLRKVFS